MLDYFQNAELIEEKTVTVASGGKAVQVDRVMCGDMPTLGGFAIEIQTHRDTLHEWCRKHASFSDAYKRCKIIQEHWLMQNGLKGNVNTAFGIFTAKNVLYWRDKIEQVHSFDDIDFDDDETEDEDDN